MSAFLTGRQVFTFVLLASEFQLFVVLFSRFLFSYCLLSCTGNQKMMVATLLAFLPLQAIAASTVSYRGGEDTIAPHAPFQVAGGRPDQLTNRPSLIDYDPVANASAVVTSADKMARFTVLTAQLIRMEYAQKPGEFEDHSTIAMLNRALFVPPFTSNTDGGMLTITTQEVVLTYTLGQPFTASTLKVTSAPTSTTKGFSSWSFGQAFPGNLLGTIRGLDGQKNTNLNCTLNAMILDNGGFAALSYQIRSPFIVF